MEQNTNNITNVKRYCEPIITSHCCPTCNEPGPWTVSNWEPDSYFIVGDIYAEGLAGKNWKQFKAAFKPYRVSMSGWEDTFARKSEYYISAEPESSERLENEEN